MHRSDIVRTTFNKLVCGDVFVVGDIRYVKQTTYTAMMVWKTTVGHYYPGNIVKCDANILVQVLFSDCKHIDK